MFRDFHSTLIIQLLDKKKKNTQYSKTDTESQNPKSAIPLRVFCTHCHHMYDVSLTDTI